MKFTPEAQEYLDRYFYAIKNELPAGQREDITAELQSNLMDTIEEQYPNAAEIDNTLIKEILLKNGSPRSVAATYHGPRYLIGPKLYPLFSQVLRIVMTVLGSILIVVYLISTFMNPLPASSIFGSVFEFIGGLWQALLTSAAMITLVFAIIERKLDDKVGELDAEPWKPDDLPEITYPQKVRLWEPILGIVGGLIYISILIYLMNVGELVAWVNGERIVAGTINEGFKALLPYAIILSGLEMANHTVIISQRMISAFSRWFKIALEILNAALLGFAINAIPLFTLIWDNFPAASQTDFITLEPMIHKTFKGFLIFIICLNIASIIKRLVTEVNQKPGYKYEY
ncbi:MAG: hypothetical protein JEZ00_20655 [Anaerolineaceae bacterium]|nr:hypothetical protein [Anaerolineaceae bacterium]